MSESASEGLSQTVVLNGLRDLCGGHSVLDDDESRAILEEAFASALHSAERDKFETEIESASDDPDELDEQTQRFITSCVEDVLASLIDRETHATLIHEVPLSVPPREAAVYSFMVSHDPSMLSGLSVDDDVRDPLDRGASAVADGEYDRAVDAFDDAVSVSGGGGGSIASRVLAGYASHCAGRESDAIDYVEETLHLATDVWTAKLVGYAADHRFPEKFRSGKLGARVFFRWSAGVPAIGDVTVSAGPADNSEAPTPLAGSDECMPFERLWPETTIQISLSGDLPSIPSVEAYYVATGVADLEVYEARIIEEVLLTGPGNAGAEERIKFR